MCALAPGVRFQMKRYGVRGARAGCKCGGRARCLAVLSVYEY